MKRPASRRRRPARRAAKAGGVAKSMRYGVRNPQKMMTLVKQIAYCPSKCVVTIPLRAQAAQGDLKFSFPRFGGSLANQPAPNAQQISYNDTAFGANRFGQLKTLFEQYAVKGVEMMYIPSNIVGSGASTIVNRVWVFEDINTMNTLNYTDDAISRLDSFRPYDPTKAFTVTRQNSTIARQENASWADRGPDVNGNVDEFPDSSIGMRLYYQGFQAQDVFGHVKLTYYITFRGQK